MKLLSVVLKCSYFEKNEFLKNVANSKKLSHSLTKCSHFGSKKGSQNFYLIYGRVDNRKLIKARFKKTVSQVHEVKSD